MKLFTFSIFLFSIVAFSKVSAQKNLHKGFIINNTNDTINGYIMDIDGFNNSRLCHFKKTPESSEIIYNPDSIKAYRFEEGKYYIAKTIDIDSIEARYFFEFLLKGEANFYYLPEGKSWFFVEKDGQIYELKENDIHMTINESDYIKTNKEYLGTLNYLLRDADISKDIQITSLNAKSLVKLGKKYHNKVCTNGSECIDYTKSNTTAHMSFSVCIAASSGGTKFASDPMLGSDYYYDINTVGSFTLNLENFPLARRNLSTHIEIASNQYYIEETLKNSVNIPLYFTWRFLSSYSLQPRIGGGFATYIFNFDDTALYSSLINS